MKHRIISTFFFQLIAFSSFGASPAPGLDTDTRIVLKSISQRYKKLQNWRATFTQDTYSVGLGKGTFSEGEFEFVAPDKFRFSIMRPDSSDFISNGKEAWQILYRHGRGKPAFVRHIKDATQRDFARYLLLLRGIDASTKAKEAALTKDFELKGTLANGDVDLDLSPRQSSEISKISLIFKNSVEAPYKAVLLDAVGNRTIITIASFDSIREAVDEKDFKPNYPKGSEVEEF